MFFNYDILFRNGPLALVWLAGNETLKNKKNGRHKVAILKSNIGSLCDTMRSLIPQMGTAHGIPLRKMGTLAKGVTIMYSLKMEHFARDVMQASIALNRPVTLTIDPTMLNEGTARAKVTFGEEYEYDQMDGVFGFENSKDIYCHIGSPRRRHTSVTSFSDTQISAIEGLQQTLHHGRDVDVDVERGTEQGKRNLRKRSRGEREDDVLERLHRVTVDVDPRAHTLVEDAPLLEDEVQPDFDFGDGLAFLNAEVVDDQIPLPVGDIGNLQGVVDESTGYCPPSNIEDGSLQPMEVTVNEGTRPENFRRRHRSDRHEVMDITVLELPEIEPIADAEPPRRGQRARRRLRLQVDRKICTDLREMLHRVEAVKAASNMASLEARLDFTRAPGKSLWGMVTHQNKTALQIIETAGRPCKSTALNEMRRVIMKKAIELPPPTEEERKGREDDTNQNSGVSNKFGGVEPSVHQEDPPLEQQQGPLEDGFGMPEEPLAPAPNEIEEGIGECQDVFVVPQDPPRRVDEQTVLGRGKTFEEMYPPENCPRSKAAQGFLLLLKMQAKTVSMHQEVSFGAIDVKKL